MLGRFQRNFKIVGPLLPLYYLFLPLMMSVTQTHMCISKIDIALQTLIDNVTRATYMSVSIPCTCLRTHNIQNLTSNHLFNKQLTLDAPARGRLDAGSQPAKPLEPREIYKRTHFPSMDNCDDEVYLSHLF